MADPKSDARAKIEEAAMAAADVAASAAFVVEDAQPDLRKSVAAFATDLFDKLLTGAERKGEAPEKAAVKISKIVLGRVEREAVAQAAKAPQNPPPAPEAQANITGKTAGVNRKLIAVLRAVSAHYDEPIRILSGKREPKPVATAIFMSWNGHLRQGKALPFFRRNEKLRLRLDKLKQDKDRGGFEATLLKAETDGLSPHMTGDAVDLALDSSENVIAALETCLNYKAEKNTEGKRVHHFDLDRLVWPIADSVKARWPKR